MTSQKTPAIPTGLRAPGRGLWSAITKEFELGAAEMAILVAACRQADDIDRVEQVIARDGAVVAGSKGQPRLSAALAEVRQGRIALAKLLAELRLPAEEDEDVGRSPTSRRAQHAARARWQREARKRESSGTA